MTIHVHIAKNQRNKERVYHFRYRIHAMQLGQNTDNIDHDNQWIKDEHDENAELLYAEKDGQIIGSLRMHLNSKNALPNSLAEVLQSNHIEKVFGAGHVAYTSRFLLDPRLRGNTIVSLLMLAQFKYALKNKIFVNFVLCPAHDVNLYLRLGYRAYQNQHIKQINKGVVPLLLCTRDLKHLLSTLSPFASHLEKTQDDNGSTFKLIADIQNLIEAEHIINASDVSTFWAEFADSHARNILNRPSLFDGLTQNELKIVLQGGLHNVVLKDEVLLPPSEFRAKAGIVLNGKLGEGIPAKAGYHWMELFREGDSFADPLFDNERQKQAELIALNKSEVVFLPIEFFEQVKRKSPLLATRLTMNLIGFLQQRASLLEEAIDITAGDENYSIHL